MLRTKYNYYLYQKHSLLYLISLGKFEQLHECTERNNRFWSGHIQTDLWTYIGLTLHHVER